MTSVSVVLTTYNGATRGFLEEAINSALNQTYDNYELIIVDDGSSDNTKEICQKYLENKKVSYIYRENGGCAAARNTGIKASKYPYVCFLDDDDMYLPEKLEKEVAFFEKLNDPKVGMVFSFTKTMNSEGEIYGTCENNADGDCYQKAFYARLANDVHSWMIKKQVFNEIGVFKDHFRQCQDIDFLIRISRDYKIRSIHQYLSIHRNHDGYRLSGSDKSMNDLYFQMVFKDGFKNAKQYIKDQKNKIYYYFYKSRSKEYFAKNDYENFKRSYVLAKIYHPVSFNLRFKNFLISNPRLHSCFKWFKKTKRKLFKRK